MNNHLHLASVDGGPIAAEPTIEVSVDPVAAWLMALAEAAAAGRLNIAKAILVAEIDGRVTYGAAGGVQIVEAIGMLEMASRRIERDARGE